MVPAGLTSSGGESQPAEDDRDSAAVAVAGHGDMADSGNTTTARVADNLVEVIADTYRHVYIDLRDPR